MENFELIITVFPLLLMIFFGHNLWLVAEESKIEAVTSDVFPVSDSAIKAERIADFRALTEIGEIALTDYKITEESLFVKPDEKIKLAWLELYPHPIVLEAEKFAGYIKSEAAESLTGADFDRPQRESYAKYAKVLVDNALFEKTVGQKFEIILQTNPANIETGGKLKVRVLFDGKPLENLRVSVGAAHLHGGKYAAHSRTDADGSAELEVSGKGLWFVRTHFIRPHSDQNRFDWESFWASVTFYI